MPTVLHRRLDSVRSGARGWIGAIVHLALLMVVAWPLGAQQGVLHEGRPALRYEVAGRRHGGESAAVARLCAAGQFPDQALSDCHRACIRDVSIAMIVTSFN